MQFGGQSGYYTDISTGEVNLTHRYYDPSTGHFLNRDPIGYNGGQNLYAFCGNNPITGSDPSGLNPTMDKEDAATIEMMVLDGTDRASATRTVLGNRARVQAKRFQDSMEVAGDGATAITMLFGIGETIVFTRAVLAGVAEEAAARTAAKVAADAAAKELAESQAKTAESVTDKLTRYLLNPEHERGGSKAKWFKLALGFDRSNLGELAKQIVFDEDEAIPTQLTEHGQKYNQVIRLTGANGKVIDVTFGWIRNNDGIVRLVTGIPPDR